MRKLLRLATAALASAILLAATGQAGAGIEPGVDLAIDPASIFATAIDATLQDTAVTDAALASVGITDNGVMTLLTDPSLLVVDDDLAQCPEADFTTINAAVAAAPPYGRVKVCPGEYRESVQIVKPGLWLQAPRHQGQATQCQAEDASDPTRYAVVHYDATLNGGSPSIGFDVHAPDVTIEGFTVEPDPTRVTSNGVGIFTDRAFTGYAIRHNFVQRNTIGVYFNSAGNSSVDHNCIRENVLGGAASGNGVYSDQGLADSSIAENYFTGHTNGAVIIDTFLTTPRDVEIVHNESINDSSIFVFSSDNVTIDYNKVVNPAGSGIGAVFTTGGSISSNHLEGGPGSFTGIVLFSADGFDVQSNKVMGFERGLRLRGGSSGNTVATNRVTANLLEGLQATDQASANTIRENHMRDNRVDCSDRTAGTGTSGTANFWINDLGYTEDRAGICKRATSVPPLP